ncbi:ABC transporter permease [Merdibacter massiliensis]|uniref:ABC transporter permease n=1 Tax=Merdibacter massiliensis TaxID=1871030 RepID=UPI00096A7D0F|nr:ABC transporter permease [Merdibacter massiliensis]
MKLIAKITLRSLKMNRWRTIASILAIFLSTVILVSVTTLASSTLITLKEREIRSSGNWHVLYQGVNGNSISAIQNDTRSKTTAITQSIGYLQGTVYNTRQPYFYLSAVNKEGFDILPYKLTEGRYPKNSNEILIPLSLTKNKQFHQQINDRISATYGHRLSNESDESLYQNTSYDPTKEYFQPLQEESFQIVGIYDDSYTAHYTTAGYAIISALDHLAPNAAYDVYVQDTEINQSIYTHAQQLYAKIKCPSLSYNKYLLLYEGVAGDTQLVFMIRMLTIVVCLIVALSSIIVIHNSFSISLSQRSRYLGMMASIGATRKQKELSVFLEAFFLSVPTIAVATLISLIATAGALHYIEVSFAQLLDNLSFLFAVDPLLLCTSICISFFTVWISAWMAARHAGKISIIDAIHQNKDIQIKQHSVKTSQLVYKIFGICASLGIKNQKRFCSRYLSVLTSLTLSFVLFVSVFSLSSYFTKSAEMVNDQIPYDVAIQYDKRVPDQIKDTDDLLFMQYAKQAVRTQTIHVSYTETTNYTPQLLAYLKASGQAGISVSIVSLDKQALESIYKQNGSSLGILDTDTAIAVNTAHMQVDSNQHTYAQFSYLKDNVQEITLETGEDSSISIPIANKIKKSHPLDAAAGKDFSLTLYVNEDYFAKIQRQLETIPTVEIYYSCDDHTQLIQEINTYLDSHDNMINYASIQDTTAELSKTASLLALLHFLLYIFLFLICAIAITNVCNTLVNSFALRSQENAVYFSIGMEKRQFYKMLFFETMLYACKSILYGLLISIPLCYIFYQILGMKFQFAFYMPIEVIFIAAFALFLLSAVMLLYHFLLTAKQNIIDTIRRESI